MPLFAVDPQSTLASDHPGVLPSVTDFKPKFAAAPEKVNVCEFGVRVAGLVSSEKLGSTPVEADVNGKLAVPELAGSVTFTIFNVASALFVIVQVNVLSWSSG